jgi:hypothetical protein
VSELFTALALITVGLALTYGGVVDLFGRLRRSFRQRRTAGAGHVPPGGAGRAGARSAGLLVYPLMIVAGLGLAVLGLAYI